MALVGCETAIGTIWRGVGRGGGVAAGGFHGEGRWQEQLPSQLPEQPKQRLALVYAALRRVNDGAQHYLLCAHSI